MTRKKRVVPAQTTSNDGVETTLRSQPALIFISHDTRDADISEAFGKLLSSVSAGVLKSFRSSDKRGGQGIEYGVEWYPEIMQKLGDASDVVCLLTSNSLNRPWLLYEAGVAKGKLNTPVYGVALGVPLQAASIGPFAQFQNSDDSEDALTKLVMQLVARIPNAEPDASVVRNQVQQFKTSVEPLLQPAYKDKKKETEEPTVAQLFEEIKLMYKDLPGKIQPRIDFDPIRGEIFTDKFDRMRFSVIERAELKSRDPLNLVVLCSALQKDFAWMMELALDVYRNQSDSAKFAPAVERLYNAVKLVVHGPLSGLIRDGFTHEVLVTLLRQVDRHKGVTRLRVPMRSRPVDDSA